MKANDEIKNNVSECLRLMADIISSGTSDEIAYAINTILKKTRAELLSTRDLISRESINKSKIESSVPEQKSLAFLENSSNLSVKEFGVDITSDIEFPTRLELEKFALSKGIKVSKRDSKMVIRKRLLASAELRNMDDLVGRDDD
ncbi:TPA: hypothetical protein RQM98_000761 [Aeromonas salmonicida]|nr:hypothetical protein [Aeromonas salmonicida]